VAPIFQRYLAQAACSGRHVGSLYNRRSSAWAGRFICKPNGMRTDCTPQAAMPPNAMITVCGMVTPDIAETLRQIILKTTASCHKVLAVVSRTNDHEHPTPGVVGYTESADHWALIALRKLDGIRSSTVRGQGRLCQAFRGRQVRSGSSAKQPRCLHGPFSPKVWCLPFPKRQGPALPGHCAHALLAA
jgi:hypothetical protein